MNLFQGSYLWGAGMVSGVVLGGGAVVKLDSDEFVPGFIFVGGRDGVRTDPEDPAALELAKVEQIGAGADELC